jgi:hypothetical protein
MSEDLFELEIEEIIDEWQADDWSLAEATRYLMRLFHDQYPFDAQEYLRAANPDLYDEQEEAEGVKRMERDIEVAA